MKKSSTVEPSREARRRREDRSHADKQTQRLPPTYGSRSPPDGLIYHPS